MGFWNIQKLLYEQRDFGNPTPRTRTLKTSCDKNRALVLGLVALSIPGIFPYCACMSSYSHQDAILNMHPETLNPNL